MLMLFQVFFIFLGKCVVWEHLTELVLSYNWFKPFLWPVRSKYVSVFPCDFNILYSIFMFFFFFGWHKRTSVIVSRNVTFMCDQAEKPFKTC